MDRRDFQPNSWVGLVRNTAGVLACAPRTLPPQIEFDLGLVSVLSAADRGLGQLGGIVRALPYPRLLIRSFISREAVLSSRIEGTQASLSDLFLFDMTPEVEERVPDVREVSNYVRALDFGLERIRHAPLSLALIKNLHAILLDEVRGCETMRGEFRTRQNWIGPPNSRIEDATYVPPPHEHVRELLEALEAFVNAPSDLPVLVRLAMIHYQFEAIHPFEDGNGRVGRLLISLLLDSVRALPYPVLYLSAYFEKHRLEYYQRLLGVSQRGEWREWLGYFLRGVADQSTDAVERSQRLIDLRASWAGLFQQARTSALLIKLLDHLFTNPFISVARAATYLDVRPQSAQNNIDQLVSRGILREVTGQKRNRIFAAPEILRILEQTPGFDPNIRPEEAR